ncbi:hypothetical protein SETIT_6G011300v2 [Setaria italica]|uniref:Uncharacterized protein n=1 Tax=Setaria italica TaxID=4555 RepID=A0A368RGR9_SETIT|nr:formin-like protein 5 [Setaria italica]RCV29409.1 hypothetical protein SETIT_6G011300v2 [Setaria italica]
MLLSSPVVVSPPPLRVSPSPQQLQPRPVGLLLRIEVPPGRGRFAGTSGPVDASPSPASSLARSLLITSTPPSSTSTLAASFLTPERSALNTCASGVSFQSTVPTAAASISPPSPLACPARRRHFPLLLLRLPPPSDPRLLPPPPSHLFLAQPPPPPPPLDLRLPAPWSTPPASHCRGWPHPAQRACPLGRLPLIRAAGGAATAAATVLRVHCRRWCGVRRGLQAPPPQSALVQMV